MWRRLRVLPFDFAKKESEQVGGLFERIMAEEAPGILARWIAKAGQYLREGISTPSVVLNARDEYIKEQDTVAEWLEARCYIPREDNDSYAIASSARESYLDWCKLERRTALSPQKFAKDLEESKGFPKKTKRVTGSGKVTQVRAYSGFEILGGSVTLHS